MFWECELLGFVVGSKFQLYTIEYYFFLRTDLIINTLNILYAEAFLDWQCALITKNRHRFWGLGGFLNSISF